MRNRLLTSLTPLLLLCSCGGSDEDFLVADPLPEKNESIAYFKQTEKRPEYPWDSKPQSITKAHFRCKGSSANPIKDGVQDCDGPNEHSLPIKNGEEFIYPCLLELLNALEKDVVITTGHRCVKHHLYARIAGQGRASKHLMGAEVAFYVKGMERDPEGVLKLIQKYYKKNFSEKSYHTWERYEKKDTDVSTKPFYNKEIFVKIYKPFEGRDFDNSHPYSYLRIQVRHDRTNDQRVLFNWDESEKNIYKHY